MSYIIEPMPLISFLDESKLKLPRFQRKPTWDKKQNFELSISVFQDYPVGVVIVNQEQKVSWLLDGRQRRSALTTMRDNPVELYEWARIYIGFAKNADELEVKNAYWDKVDKYLQTEEKLIEDNENESDIIEYDGEESSSSSEENSFDSLRQRQGLQTLLDLILMVHQNKPSGSKWEQTFNFKKYFSRLNYAPVKNGEKIVPKLLRRFILDFIKYIDHEYEGVPNKDNFIEYYQQTFILTNKNDFEKEVEKRWDLIQKSIDVISKSEKIFADARIGIIRLTNATPLDAQNIFARINKGGTQLKSEELLSAKPYWNKSVTIRNISIVENVKDMYAKLEIPTPDTIVRWDLAATLISRIKDKNLIFDSYIEAKQKKEVSMDEITLGFKLISSIYEGGMSAKHVNNLEKNDNIKWENDIDVLVDELNTVCKILLEDSFFKYLLSWSKPINKLLGNAIALEFITILWKDWYLKGCPHNNGAEWKALQREARILFDRLVFEYATKAWRGSGDSKMANDIKSWQKRVDHIPLTDWENFIKGACEGNFNGQPTTVKLLRPILYYYYILIKKSPTVQADISFDVDHIIPKEIFKDNKMIVSDLKDSLINLALLPKKENISKRSKALKDISDSWLKDQISFYTEIDQSNFEKYSDVSNLKDLKVERMNNFLQVFNINRETILSNCKRKIDTI